MTKRILIALLALVLALISLPAAAESAVQEQILQLLAHVRGDLEMQAWLDEALAADAGSSGDNYIILLRHAEHGLALDSFLEAADARLQTDDTLNPVARQRCALALIACGAPDRVPAELVDETAGKLGVMSNVFALHLLNNGAQSALWNAESMADALIDLQKADGGWAVTGDYGDVDVTAMCLQAFALCPKNERIQGAMDSAIAFLSEKQLESGGFASYGTENAESAAQVVIALSALEIDADQDARFIKNGHSALGALQAYRVEGGGFAHLLGEKENATANLQALQAFIAYNQLGVSYYDLQAEPSFILKDRSGAQMPAWKRWAFAAIGALAVIGCVFAILRRRGRMKRLLFVLAAAGIAFAAVWMLDIQTASQYYGTEPEGANGEVYISIRCDTVAGLAEDGSTPADGIVLDRCAIPFTEGESVFDALMAAARKYEIQVEHQGGSGDSAYILGIQYLYEYDYGNLSGWIYRVNGETPSIGCGAYMLQAGDEIRWDYTTKLGEDLK